MSSRWQRVEQRLRTAPQEFDFFQTVRLIERILPDREPVGRFVPPVREVTRFRAHNSLPFPASQIQNIHWPEAGPPAIIVNFMGLTGPMGAMPLYYTALIVERLRSKDTAIAAFFDLFNHRLISLFYEAWEKYRFPISYERGERDKFSHHLLDLLGLGTRFLQDRLRVDDDSLLYYAGLLSLHPRSATGLRQILEDYFDVPVEIEQFMGAWYRLDEPTQCNLDRGFAASEQLGQGAVVGDEIWSREAGVRVKLGPLTLTQYLDFLPNGSAWPALGALTKFYSNGQLDFEVQLILKREQVPVCELGQLGMESPLLGWVSWAKTAPMGRDPGDTILRI